MSPSTIKQHIRKISFSQQFIIPAEPRETSDISDSFASGEINVPQIMENSDKQINEKQTHCCSIYPATPDQTPGRVSFCPQVSPALRSDASIMASARWIQEAVPTPKKYKLKQHAVEKQREILSFYTHFTAVGKSRLAKHCCNLELISGSILEISHPSPPPRAASRTATTECSSAFPHPKNSFL